MSEAGTSPDGQGVDQSRRKFLTVATSATAAVGAVFAATPFVASWRPSERARAMGAPVEFDVDKLEPGQMVTLVWRKQPIYVVRRTEESVKTLGAHAPQLKDPGSSASLQPEYAKNEMRSRRADVLVIITEWDQFRALDFDRIKLLMKTPTLVDLRNIYTPEDLRSRGFKYASIGRA